MPQNWQGTDTVTSDRIRPPASDDYQDNINRHARINTRCPSCGYQTIIIGAGRLLVCAFLGCRDPLAINEAADAAHEHERIAAAAKRLRLYVRHMDHCHMHQPSLLWAGDGPNRCTCGLSVALEDLK